MPVRRDQHGRAEPHPFGDPGQPAQRRERLEERRRILLGDVRRDRDVVGHHQQVVPEPFDDPRPVPQARRIRPRPEVRHIHSKFHAPRLSRQARRTEEISHGVRLPWPWIRR
jgi:hypothetical protein